MAAGISEILLKNSKNNGLTTVIRPSVSASKYSISDDPTLTSSEPKPSSYLDSTVFGPTGILGTPMCKLGFQHGTSTSKKESLTAKSIAFKILDSPKYIEPMEVSRLGKRKLKQMRKVEREKTKGPGWYNMGAPELTTERKNDMEALRLRGALETKRFYKRNNITSQPKYFQVGRIVETPADYYSSRIPKKQRKQTLAEEFASEIDK